MKRIGFVGLGSIGMPPLATKPCSRRLRGVGYDVRAEKRAPPSQRAVPLRRSASAMCLRHEAVVLSWWERRAGRKTSSSRRTPWRSLRRGASSFSWPPARPPPLRTGGTGRSHRPRAGGCPGVGRRGGREGRQLSIMTAAPRALFERVKPVTRCHGLHGGLPRRAAGQGATAKAVNQLLCGAIGHRAEGLSLAGSPRRRSGRHARHPLGSAASSWNAPGPRPPHDAG